MRNGISAVAALAVMLSGAFGPAQADEVIATVHEVTQDGVGEKLGEVRFEDSRFGLLVMPDLRRLTAGPHAAHIHEKPDCEPATLKGKTVPGGGAGGHFDPDGTDRHEGPYGDGHLGDLPVLIVEKDGTATTPVLAPRLETDDIHDRSLIIHAGVDRYEHHGVHAHGKGGMRMYCAVIP